MEKSLSMKVYIHSTTDIKKNVHYQEIDVTAWMGKQRHKTVYDAIPDNSSRVLAIQKNTVKSAVRTIKNKMC